MLKQRINPFVLMIIGLSIGPARAQDSGDSYRAGVYLGGCNGFGCTAAQTAVTDTGGFGAENIDADADGYDTAEDCDDSNSLINPAAEETCDGVDNNCDGQVDEDITITAYIDADGDGFGPFDTETQVCEITSGYTGVAGDCDDDNPDINPVASDNACNGIDDNCDNVVDEGSTHLTWFEDLDGDSYGNPAVQTEACSNPFGYVTSGNPADCNDTDAAVHPNALEVPGDGVDDNCDGSDLDAVTVWSQVEYDGLCEVWWCPVNGGTCYSWHYGISDSTEDSIELDSTDIVEIDADGTLGWAIRINGFTDCEGTTATPALLGTGHVEEAIDYPSSGVGITDENDPDDVYNVLLLIRAE